MKTLVAIAAALVVTACAGTPGPLPPLVTVDWLATHLHDRDLVILHAGEAEAFAKAHIPGARRVTLGDVSVSGGGDGLSIQVPPADDLRTRLEALGISDGSRVIVSFAGDFAPGATRILFTLDQAGLGAHAALLDGGQAAWQRAGHAVTDAASATTKGKLAPLTMGTRVVDASTVVASLGKPGFAVVDARDRSLYDGVERGGMPGHEHALGHIRGAHSVPYTSVWDDTSHLRSDAELAAIFARAGVAPGDTVIGYCHIGIQATAMLFAARRLGHPVFLYDGSFEDWSLNHAGFPVAVKE